MSGDDLRHPALSSPGGVESIVLPPVQSID